MKREDVVRLLADQSGTLSAQFGVKTLRLFGSVARNEAKQGSDVDLLVDFDRPTGLFGLFALQNHLEEVFGCPVDLGTPESLKPRIRDRILQEAIHVA